MDVRRSSYFIQQAIVGESGDLAQNRRNEIYNALHVQERAVQQGLQEQQERFEHQVGSIEERIAAFDPLDPRRAQLQALQGRLNRLKEIQQQLLKGTAEKREELKEQKASVRRARNDLANSQNQLYGDRFLHEKRFLLDFGSAVCHHVAQ